MDEPLQADGFPGQRLVVLPRPLVQEALQEPLTRDLLVTDGGYFPLARRHAMTRRHAIDQAVILLCIAGRGSCTVADESHGLRAGQVAILPPGVPHTYRADPDEPWTLWWLHIAGAAIPDLLSAARVTPENPVRDINGFSRAVELIEEAIALLDRNLGPAGLLGASGAAWHLLTALALPVNRADRHAELVHEVQCFVQENLAGALSVAELATRVKMSPSHFAMVFRAETGSSVMNYVSQVRMARARELLDTTEAPIKEIAARCGFGDALYFSRRFSDFHGTSPSRYRALEKG